MNILGFRLQTKCSIRSLMKSQTLSLSIVIVNNDYYHFHYSDLTPLLIDVLSFLIINTTNLYYQSL